MIVMIVTIFLWLIIANKLSTSLSSSAENAFQVAFKGNREWLANNLDVTEELLRVLIDKSIITKEHLSRIKQVSDKFDRVDALLTILERRGGDQFPHFCDILDKDGQKHVVDRICSSPSSTTSTSSFGLKGFIVIVIVTIVTIFLCFIFANKRSISPPSSAMNAFQVDQKRNEAADVAKQQTASLLSSDMNAFQAAFKGNLNWLARYLDVTNGLLRVLTDERIITEEHLLKIRQGTHNADRVERLLNVLGCRDGSLFTKFCDILKKSDQEHVARKLRSTYNQATTTTGW